mmetsp:Transcript_45102/g.57743  ORF Transcript_45102/g.57743 Transcript_45102/m.57743 type:complete len:754 (-) Transcript_45102:163-2424(-)
MADTKDFAFDIVCYLASAFHSSLLVFTIETLSIAAIVFGACVLLILRRVFPFKVFKIGSSLFILGCALCASSINFPPNSFDAETYKVSNFHSLTSFPKFPPLLLDNSTLRTNDKWFIDSDERVLLLRGVNLAGATKLPSIPDGSTWRNVSDGFWVERGEVSFVGRPFPLEEADEHFGRLRAWGLTFLRLLITWEAVEHRGPGEYDKEYLEYLVQIVRKADEYGVSVFMDPHQDVWSRWSGGDGAPYWTLEAAGFNIDHLGKTGAAITHQEHGDPLPAMIWSTNNWRLATATMFTLFFAGNTYAPGVTAFDTDVPIQDFLQEHFVGAMKQVATALRLEKNVVGFDTLNEPNSGWIGRMDLASRSDGLSFRWGLDLSPFEQMAISSGYGAVVAEMYNPPFVLLRKEEVNPHNLSAWGPKGCVWRRAGVWDLVDGVPTLLRPQHFALSDASLIDDFMVPLWLKLRGSLDLNQPQPLITFAEPPIDFNDPANHEAPNIPRDHRSNWAYAPHWYEVVGLISKSYCSWLGIAQWQSPIWQRLTGSAIIGPVIGQENLVNGYSATFASLAHTGEKMGGPTLIGETGIAMDMMSKSAFTSGDWSSHVAALDNVMTALDNNLLSFTLWNYSPQNMNARGDQWNDEDLSLFSKDQVSARGVGSNPYEGGRALPAAVRPYARKVSADPVSMKFNLEKTRFDLVVSQPRPKHPTEIFVPLLHYPDGVEVTVSSGHFDYLQGDQVLLWWHAEEEHDGLQTLTISKP